MKVDKTKNFAINTFFSMIYQMVFFLSGLVIPRVMLSVFGSEINGLTSSISQFISYFTLVEAGLSSAAIYALYTPLEKNDYNEINIIVKTTHIFYKKSGFVFLFLSVAFAIIYPLIVKVSNLSYLSVFILVMILSVSGVIDFFTLSKYRALLTSDQKSYIISIGNILYYVVFTAVIVVVAKVFPNIIIVRGVALLSVILRTVFLKIYCKYKYKFLDLSVQALPSKLNKRWDALYLQILSSIHTGVPTIIATFVTNLLAVSVYSVYNMVVAGVGGIVGIFTSGLYANFGHVLAIGDEENTKNVYEQFEVSFHIVSTIIYSLTIVLIIPFVKIYTKGIVDVNYINVILAILMVTNGFIYNLKTPQGTMIIAAGHFKETRVQTTVQGAIALIGGLIGAIVWGLEGMMVGILLSNIYRVIDVFFYLPRHILSYKTSKSVSSASISILLYCLFLVLSVVSPISPTNFFEWILIAVIYGILITIIVVVAYFVAKKKVVLSIFKRVKRIFKK